MTTRPRDLRLVAGGGAASDGAAPLLDLWRRWSALVTELQAPAALVPENEEDAYEAAVESQRHAGLRRELAELKAQMVRAEIRTPEDLAAALDVMLETEVRLPPIGMDRRMLNHVAATLAKLAPAVRLGSLQRQVVRDWMEGLGAAPGEDRLNIAEEP